MPDPALHAEVQAKLEMLHQKYPELKKRLEEAYAYAIFPSVGRAGAVVGVGRGHGEVFERGRSIGSATLTQITVGVTVGGQIFTEVLVFDTKEALKAFRTSPVEFTANASAVIVKAAASGTTDFGGVDAIALSEGGELLELSLGGQKFSFLSSEQEKERADRKAAEPEEKEKGPGLGTRIASKFRRGKGEEGEGKQAQQAHDAGEQRGEQQAPGSEGKREEDEEQPDAQR